MNVFLFQSTPERYDLRVDLRQGRTETWLASRYRHAMRHGDIVYFWMAGPESIRGLYGWGRITRKPRGPLGADGVRVVVERKFAKPVLVAAVREDPVLAKMLILRVPQASNFLLSAEEAKRVAALVARHDEAAPERQNYTKPTARPSVANRDRVFISYSHVDGIWLQRLQVHLAPLTRRHRHVLWDDTKITAGEKWRVEINRAMSMAKVAVLIVSADFLASEFIMENELPNLLAAAADQGAVILPIIAAPCRFRETASLAQYQSVNPPSKPLSAMSIHEREDTFYQVSIAVEGALAAARKTHD